MYLVCAKMQRYVFLLEMVKGGYTPWFFGYFGGYRRNARTAGVPACPNLPQMQLQRAGKTPVAHPCRARTPFCFIFEYVLGLNETAALEGANGSPLLTTSGGVMTAQVY